MWRMISCIHNQFLATALTVCLTVVPTAGAFADVHVSASETSEFPAETAAIVAATTALFDAVEGNAQRAPEIRPIIGGIATPASLALETSKTAALNLRGPVRHLTGYRISWYPVDRFLGAVDFMGTWDGNRNLVCGYVTWDLSDPDTPVLDRIVANYIDVSALSDATPADAHQQLLTANCAYGEIDPNFTVFEPAN